MYPQVTSGQCFFMAYSELVTRWTRHMWGVHFFTKKWIRLSELVTKTVTGYSELATLLTRHTVISSHWRRGDLVTQNSLLSSQGLSQHLPHRFTHPPHRLRSVYSSNYRVHKKPPSSQKRAITWTRVVLYKYTTSSTSLSVTAMEFGGVTCTCCVCHRAVTIVYLHYNNIWWRLHYVTSSLIMYYMISELVTQNLKWKSDLVTRYLK